MSNILRPLRRLYDWVLSWASSPAGSWALFFIAVAESSFFPIPPDILLIALGISIPRKSFKYALICSLGSVLGGLLGYLIGYGFRETIGNYIITLYGAEERVRALDSAYRDNAFIAVAIAGFTPIPYKIFTIAAGISKVSIPIFLLASLISRSARFFLVATIIYFGGNPAKRFIDRYFNILTIAIVILIILGFVLLKLLL